MSRSQFIDSLFAASLPPDPVASVVAWGEEHVRLPGSARSERFDSAITPWTREVIETAGDGITRKSTFIKPVQSGGSVAGEVVLCFWLATNNGGDLQYNWQNDEKAGERWTKRINKIVRACEPVMARAGAGLKCKKGLLVFPHCNLTVQGVFSDANVASDSIRYQINEEVHDEEGGWHPGRLQQAFNRTTAFWNSIILSISNAGYKGDQLEVAYLSGTQQKWTVKCPGCKKYHPMRTAWDEKHPYFGGLRYDSSKCKREDGSYNYNRLASTIHYQMPCGYKVLDDVKERRQLSLSGKYSEPHNKGAHISNRSFTLEAVAVDYISWLSLIEEKHRALKALKYGDPKPLCDYVRERESRFWDPEDRPFVGKVILSSTLKKDREGLPGRHARLFALDYQQGNLEKGELPHWWLVIRDVMPNGDSRLAWEGKCLTDEDAIATIDRHECIRRHGVADSGFNATHVYQFCLKYGINAIKGSPEALFSHGKAGLKIFSVEKPLHQVLNAPPTREDPLDEPQFWFYSKVGIRDRLAWLRGGKAVRWEVPGDVSDDYQAHMEAEEQKEKKNSEGRTTIVWQQVKTRNDLFVCECYIAMLMEMAGLIGVAAIDNPQSK
jgi:hypothetical protein